MDKELFGDRFTQASNKVFDMTRMMVVDELPGFFAFTIIPNDLIDQWKLTRQILP